MEVAMEGVMEVVKGGSYGGGYGGALGHGLIGTGTGYHSIEELLKDLDYETLFGEHKPSSHSSHSSYSSDDDSSDDDSSYGGSSHSSIAPLEIGVGDVKGEHYWLLLKNTMFIFLFGFEKQVTSKWKSSRDGEVISCKEYDGGYEVTRYSYS